MDSGDAFSWTDGDIILRATQGTESRDFRVHKMVLSFSSPVFKDMFALPQPASTTSAAETIDMADPPRALDIILRFFYPSTDPPLIDDVAILAEVLTLVDKYEVTIARSRIRPTLMEFADTDPLRTYAIACKLGSQEEMKVAAWNTRSLNVLGLAELPEEFKSIPATEYHRLVLWHRKWRKHVEAIAAGGPWSPMPEMDDLAKTDLATTRQMVIDAIRKGEPLNCESLVHTVVPPPGATKRAEEWVRDFVSAVLVGADTWKASMISNI